VLFRSGELDDAAHALTTARRLVRDDPLRTAHLLWLHARIAERVGHVTRAVRWCGRALHALEDVDGDLAAASRSHIVATLAAVRQRQGRTPEAVRLAEQAIADAEAASEELALGHACQILDWALVESGHADEAGYSARALEIFRRRGTADRESAVLNNMGGFAYRAGRWDDAISLYRQGGDASRRAGDVNFGAFADCNVGEVLSDQGRLEAAEPLLRRALQVWRGTADDHGVAFATALLGRLHARAGRAAEASAALEDALARFRAMRVEIDAALADALLAEAAAFAGRPEEARRRALQLRPALPPNARLEPLLDHVAGVASAQMGELAASVDRLTASLDAARRYQLPFEELLALDALVALEGPAASARRRERDRLLEQLDVIRVPAPPVSAVSGTADPPRRRGP